MTEGPGPSDPGINAFTVSDSNIFASSDMLRGVYLSSDNGDNWIPVSNGLPDNPPTQCLTNIGSNIFVGTSYYGIFRSLNNGLNWIEINTGLTSSSVNCLYAYDSNLYAGTYGSGVFLSNNNGTNWSPVNSGLEYQIILSLVVKDSVLFAATLGGGVWMSPLSELVTDVTDNANNKIPSSFILEQNYPNPFNPTTTIKYSIPQSGFVTIKVFNLLGQEVATLVSKEQRAGEYSIEFSAKGGSASGGNASNLASGIYMYRLQAGNYSLTRKMILLK